MLYLDMIKPLLKSRLWFVRVVLTSGKSSQCVMKKQLKTLIINGENR